MTSRKGSYITSEDKLLCQSYLHVSQNPIIGNRQSRDQFWKRVEDDYNAARPANVSDRNTRSLESRMAVIQKACGKLRACVRQIENLNPSGAQDKDILNRAMELLAQDKEYKKGFKFLHVWDIMKDCEKFAPHVGDTSSPKPSGTPTSSSNGLSQFSINLSDDNGSASERPIGVKKAKLKKKQDDDNVEISKVITAHNAELLDALKKKNEQRDQNREDKILFLDLNTLAPNVRAYVEIEQLRILQKRTREQYMPSFNTSDNSFSQLFGDIGGGSGGDIGGGSGGDIGGGSGGNIGGGYGENLDDY